MKFSNTKNPESEMIGGRGGAGVSEFFFYYESKFFFFSVEGVGGC